MDKQTILDALNKHLGQAANHGPAASALIPQTDTDGIILTTTTQRNLRKILPAYTGLSNLLLVGDAGVGKNALLYYLNTLRKHPLIRYSFNGDTLAEELIGSYRLEIGESNKFVWVDGPLTSALRNGYTFVADEMNLAAPEVLKRFSSVFEHGYLDLVEGGGERVHAAEGFSYIATQNPSEGFEGRKPLPREIQKHFNTVFLDSYDGAELAGILSELYPKLPKGILERIVAINAEMEHLLNLRKIGQSDLERYHYNLRNMKVLCARLMMFAAPQKFSSNAVVHELEHVYLYPFRKKEDHRIIECLFIKYLDQDNFQEYVTSHGLDPEQLYLWPAKDLQYMAEQYKETFPERHHFLSNNEDIESESDIIPTEAPTLTIKKDTLSLGNASFDLPDGHGKVIESILESTPLLNKDLSLLAVLLSGISNRENLLLEGNPEIEAERIVSMLCKLLGKKLTTIYFSKGMHTSDILGGLKPVADPDNADRSKIVWLDGPLTSAIRDGDFILFKGLEAANAEIIEKLNMLTDDARAITLPPESEETESLALKDDGMIFALKYHRTSQSKPTISRAFRNRFSAINIQPDYHAADLAMLVDFFLDFNLNKGYKDLGNRMAVFHIEMQKRTRKRKIGSDKIEPYRFGYLNYMRWIDALNDEVDRIKDLLHYNDEIEIIADKALRESLKTYLSRKVALRASQGGESQPNTEDRKLERFMHLYMLSLHNSAEQAYFAEISSKKDRELVSKLFLQVFGNMEIDLDWELVSMREGEEGLDVKKKSKLDLQKKKVWWDQKKHFREANTGKADKKASGRNSVKQGVEIDTPETGGETKEGPDAWYGKDTMGNKGTGPVGGGGGAWGYRTEELYQNFLKKRKLLWDYNIVASLQEFNETFGPMIEQISIDFDRLFDPEVDIVRLNQQSGFKVDARRYMKYITGKGDDKIFDNTRITINDDKLKGVEIVFAINKGRRLFNFNFALATLVSIMCSARILSKHKLPMTAFGYSDKTNMKRDVNLDAYLDLQQDYGPNEEERLFDGLCTDWFGDTVAESQILESATEYFSPDAQTPIVIMVSDFRGHRGKKTVVDEINAVDVAAVHKKVDELQKRGYVVLGVQVGNRAIAEHLFNEYLEIDEDNYSDMPSLLAGKITDIILKYKKAVTV